MVTKVKLRGHSSSLKSGRAIRNAETDFIIGKKKRESFVVASHANSFKISHLTIFLFFSFFFFFLRERFFYLYKEKDWINKLQSGKKRPKNAMKNNVCIVHGPSQFWLKKGKRMHNAYRVLDPLGSRENFFFLWHYFPWDWLKCGLRVAGHRLRVVGHRLRIADCGPQIAGWGYAGCGSQIAGCGPQVAGWRAKCGLST